MTNNATDLRRENEIRQGLLGEGPQNILRDFEEKQAADIVEETANFQTRQLRGTGIEREAEGGAIAGRQVQRESERLDEGVRAAYNVVEGKTARFTGTDLDRPLSLAFDHPAIGNLADLCVIRQEPVCIGQADIAIGGLPDDSGVSFKTDGLA